MEKISSILLFFLLLGLQSCNNEEESFPGLSFEISGVTLNADSNVLSSGKISSSKNELTFIAAGDYAHWGFLSEFTVGNESHNIGKSDYQNSDKEKVISGDWGYVELISPIPYTTKVVISENKNLTEREFRLRFGTGDYISEIRIIQEAASTEEINWDNIICNQLSANDIYIGGRYLGIQNWNCIGNPPEIYPSAVFPESSFANLFDNEITYAKRPIVLYTDFSDPFISTIEHPSGASYLRFLKELFNSEESSQIRQPQLHLFRLCNIASVDNINDIFPDNENIASTLKDIIQQKINVGDTESWTVGEIIFRGFTVTMDVPGKSGLFEDDEINTEGMVYLRSMTYGATAYFVIGSDLSYDEVKTIISTPSMIWNASQKLSNSTIVFISNSSLGQNATLSTSFDALHAFMEEPYCKEDYGYPVYCTGCYVNDNSFFHINTNF